MKFAEAFPNAEIVSRLSAKLGWSHPVASVALKTPEARPVYAHQAAQDGWSMRELIGCSRQGYALTSQVIAAGQAGTPREDLGSLPLNHQRAV